MMQNFLTKKNLLNNKKRGFTLIELLVVIGIIGILASILLIDLKSTKQKANMARFSLEAKQIALALQLYYDKYGDWPGQSPSTPGDYNWPTFEGLCLPGPYSPDSPCFVPEFYSKWDASYACSDCKYSYWLSDVGSGDNPGGERDGKPDCGMVVLNGTGVGNINKAVLCITKTCNVWCGLTW